MTRVLFTCWPFVGHLLPQLSIAAALRDRGAEVAFLTGRAARDRVERAGATAFAFERVDERAIAATVAELEARAGAGRPRVRDVRRCFDRWLVDPIPDELADVEAACARFEPDVIVCDVAFWGPIVVGAETWPVPVALSTIFLGPTSPSADAPPPGLGLPSPRGPLRRAACRAAAAATDLAARRLRRRVEALRAAAGLAPLGTSVNAAMARLPLTIVPGVRELDYGRREVPASVRYVGQLPWRDAASAERSAWLDRIPGDRPWVHVAAATMAGADPFLLGAAARGLADAGVEVVATTGGRPVPGDLPPEAPAPNVHVAGWVDHTELLGRCAAVVTAGGSGTIMAALAAGVPLVVVPTTWDKPDNAQRVVEAGVGVRLSPRRCTPDRLRAAVERVLGDPAYRDAAQRMARRIAAAPGPAGAAALVDELARRRRAPEPAGAVPGRGA
jgi:MGT family glycosyltransferase